MKFKIFLLIATCLLLSTIYYNSLQFKVQENNETLTANLCQSYLPYDISRTPQVQYYNWFGLLGKDIKGTTYQTGHVFERHLALNGACTLEQKQQNKTVFYNMAELLKAANQIPCVCDIPNRTTFTYDYDGKIASPTDYIIGIDCKTGIKQSFPAYFVQFKRAIRNTKPTSAEYLNSNHTTIWTFYPKKLTQDNQDNIEQIKNLQENV